MTALPQHPDQTSQHHVLCHVLHKAAAGANSQLDVAQQQEETQHVAGVSKELLDAVHSQNTPAAIAQAHSVCCYMVEADDLGEC